jgi:uncharacterized membrane protein YphA (DoxX/SURF4 family)
LEYIEHRKADLDHLQAREREHLGNGYGLDMARLKETKALVSSAKAALLADADALLGDLMKQVFEGTLKVRLERPSASADSAILPPSKFVDKDDKKLADILPVGKADGTGFDALPTDIKHLWTNFQAAFKTAYPMDEAVSKQADAEAGVAKERFARWYFDKDEFTGADKPGLSPLVKNYRDSAAKLASLKPQVEAWLKDMDGTWDASWFTRSVYQTVSTVGDKATSDADKARTALLNALDGKYGELRKAMTTALPTDVADGKVALPAAPRKLIERMDWYTRWTLAAVGAMLMMGLFTRLSCLVAVGFLVMTYLTHPPFPWLPLPPATEGNPIYVNKNLIELVALLALAGTASGRWAGLDGVLHWMFGRKDEDPQAPATEPTTTPEPAVAPTPQVPVVKVRQQPKK